jgi:pimeloyl-ACP methyl ester carboxylesterase
MRTWSAVVPLAIAPPHRASRARPGPRAGRPRLGLLGLLAASLAACTDEAAPAPIEPAPGALPWGACPPGFQSECARMTLPLDAAAPAGESISVLLARRPAPAGPARAQLWLVMGGPGDSAAVFAELGLVDALAQLLPDTDVYVLEHRGVGESTRLGCSQEAARPGDVLPLPALRACLAEVRGQWGDRLGHFSTRAAALDLQTAIERARAPGQRVVVYGVSYGTYLVQALAQLAPDAADAIVLDSAIAPGTYRLDAYDTHWDAVAQQLAARCGADAACAARLGRDPWPRVRAALAKLVAGGCPGAQLGSAQLADLVIPFLDDRARREHLFPLLYRVERCGPGDAAVVARYLTAMIAAVDQAAITPRASDVIRTQISLAEQWSRPLPDPREVQARCDRSALCPRVASRLAQAAALWPLPEAPLLTAPVVGSRPLLILNGTMDGKTPSAIASAFAPWLRAPGQSLVLLPDVPHVAIATSPTRAGGPIPCGLALLAQFVADPAAPLDTSCTTELAPIDFVGDPAANREAFGVPSRWDP